MMAPSILWVLENQTTQSINYQPLASYTANNRQLCVRAPWTTHCDQGFDSPRSRGILKGNLN